MAYKNRREPDPELRKAIDQVIEELKHEEANPEFIPKKKRLN